MSEIFGVIGEDMLPGVLRDRFEDLAIIGRTLSYGESPPTISHRRIGSRQER